VGGQCRRIRDDNAKVEFDNGEPPGWFAATTT
jgi:hypothetical protein